MIKGMTRKDYMKDYLRRRSATILCVYCNYYCTKYDKHYKSKKHIINMCTQLNLNKELFL
jgi:hypothetical protein